MVYGAALEKRQWACHLVPLDTASNLFPTPQQCQTPGQIS